jgi:hypothetical protein
MKYAIITKDIAIVDTIAGAATVTFSPSPITGSGKHDVGGVKVCIDGDESTVVWVGTYIKGAYLGGVCTAKIKTGSCKTSSKVKSNNKKVIIEGIFDVEVTVTSPALMPNGTPDASPSYDGTGKFTTTNTKLQVS